MGTAVSFKQRLNDYFGPSFRAISEKQDFDFIAIMQVQEEQEDGTVIALMWPEPHKNFYLKITDQMEKNGEWWLITPNETWVLRKLDPERAKGFAKAMADEGVSRG